MKQLIYAAYGSNLMKERLLIYIKGGDYKGKKYQGFTDKTEPEDWGWSFVPYKVYFAKESDLWNNKGVAFLSTIKEEDESLFSVVRFWKITERQFKELKEEEGNWYQKEICLGILGGLEIKTFTGDFLENKNPPSDDYLEVIRKGLKETTKWEDEKIENYINRILKN